MTRTVYLLSNGTKVYTFAEAVSSGMSYIVRYEAIKDEHNASAIALTKAGQKIVERKRGN